MNLEKTIIGIISISAIKCMILNPSPFANIRYGGQLVLTCEADNEWDSISWRRASDVSYTFVFRKADCETKDNGEGKRAICSKSLNKTTIIFYDTKAKNNDTWECLVAYPGNRFESERTKVFINDPSIDISNETEVLYGEEADILCTLDPGWSRCTWRSVQNDEEIFSIISCRNMTATNYSLNCDINNVTLHVVTPIHQEVFECAGYYFIGEETHSPKGRTMIFIYAMPPRVHILPSTDPTEFFSFKLLCTAIGHPIPTVVWKYENEEINRSVGENAIVFTKLNRTDSGNYSCEGISSHLGTTLKNTTHYILTVQYPPIARINDLVVSCGDNVSIGCLVDEGIPTDYTLLKWEHRFNGTFIQKLNVSNRQFFISHMTLSDIGEYVCVVSNGVMDINRNMFIEGSGNLQASSCSPTIINIEESLLQGILTLKLKVISIPPVKEVHLLHKSNNATLSMKTETTYEFADIEHYIHNVSVAYPGQIISVETKEVLNKNDTYTVFLSNHETAATNISIYISLKEEYQNKTWEKAENESGSDVVIIIISSISVLVVFVIIGCIIWMRKRKKIKLGKSISKSTKQILLDNEGYVTPGKIDEKTYSEPGEIDKKGAEETVIGTNTTPGETGQENSTEKGDSRKDYLTVVPAARTEPTVQMQIPSRSEVNEQSDHYDKIKDTENNDGYTTIEESIAHEYTGLRHQTSAPNPLMSTTAGQSNNANISGFPALIDSIGFKPASSKNPKKEEDSSSKNTDVDTYLGSDYLGPEQRTASSDFGSSTNTGEEDEFKGSDYVPSTSSARISENATPSNHRNSLPASGEEDEYKGSDYVPSTSSARISENATPSNHCHSLTTSEEDEFKGSDFVPSTSSAGISENATSSNHSPNLTTSDTRILHTSENESERSNKNIIIEETTQL